MRECPYAASVSWPVSGHLALKFLLYAREDSPHSLRQLLARSELFKPFVSAALSKASLAEFRFFFNLIILIITIRANM